MTLDDLKLSGEIVAAVGGSVLLLLPGWVTSTVYQRGARGPEPPDRTLLLQYAFAGVTVHLSIIWWTAQLLRDVLRDGPAAHVVAIVLWMAALLIAIPITVGAGFAYLLELADRKLSGRSGQIASRIGISAAVRIAEAWTFAWRGIAELQEEIFIRVTRTDGSVLLGKVGSASLASSDTRCRDLYVEELWQPDEDGWFREALPQTLGVWVAGEQIALVEFFAGVDSPEK